MTGYHHYKVCIDICLRTAMVCNNCVINCAKELNADKLDCIQLASECAIICSAAAELMSIGSARVKEIARLCAVMCDECAKECSKHMDDHCMECAEACTACADACEVI